VGKKRGGKIALPWCSRYPFVSQMATQMFCVIPVTHTPPAHNEDAVIFPQDIKRHIGLDDTPSWIVTTEANAFRWPGPDVIPVPGRTPTTMIYGLVPESLLRLVARSYLRNREKQRSQLVQRTE